MNTFTPQEKHNALNELMRKNRRKAPLSKSKRDSAELLRLSNGTYIDKVQALQYFAKKGQQ
jgi:hypothetical protein